MFAFNQWSSGSLQSFLDLVNEHFKVKISKYHFVQKNTDVLAELLGYLGFDMTLKSWALDPNSSNRPIATSIHPDFCLVKYSVFNFTWTKIALYPASNVNNVNYFSMEEILEDSLLTLDWSKPNLPDGQEITVELHSKNYTDSYANIVRHLTDGILAFHLLYRKQIKISKCSMKVSFQ